MTKSISIGIDLGTQTTRVVVGEFVKGENHPRVIGVGEASSSGMRRGYIKNKEEALKSLKLAISRAEKSSGVRIRRAFVSMNSLNLRGDISVGASIITKADSEVTNLDTKKSLEEAENNLSLGNRKILQVFPVGHRLDGKEVFGRPEGMYGNKLETRAIFATCNAQHFNDLVELLALAGVETMGIIPGAISASQIALSKKQKIAGCVLVNIGAETVSMAVYENESLSYLKTFGIGANDITNDIALGLKVSLEQAEEIKLGKIPEKISKKKVDEIIEARFADIFEAIDNHLKKIKRNELLPAGAIFVGGGAHTENLESMTISQLKLPATIGAPEVFGNPKTKLRDPVWFTALGLLTADKGSESINPNSFGGVFKTLKRAIKSGIKQIMP